MVNNYLIRRFELILVITAATGYVTKSLFYDAGRTEDLIQLAKLAGVPIHKILQDLIHYDHTWNHNMPVIVSAVMFLTAWYLFHYLLFPSIQEEKFRAFEVTLITIIIGLVISSSFVWHNTIHVVTKSNQAGMVIGLSDVTTFRKLFVLSDSIAFLTLICAYEWLAQSFYTLYNAIREDSKGKILSYFLVTLVCLLFFTAAISMRIVPFILHTSTSRILLAIILVFIYAYILQEYYFRNIHFSFADDSLLNRYRRELSIYFLLIGIASIMFWGIGARFKTDISLSQLWVPVWLLVFPIGRANSRRNKAREKIELTTQVSNKSAELTSLRAQINPHFLFNALNSLYATALIEKGEKTADGIQKLGDMMRFMLHENNHDRIPLSSEIEYLHNYIALQRMRLDETQNIEIRVNIQEAEREIYIAPMLLNPFIENAFKHGISFQNPSWIYITLTMDTTRIYFKVHNSIHKTPIHDPEEGRSGIGLENVQKRLHLIYPDKHTLEIQKSERDYFIALTLNW